MHHLVSERYTEADTRRMAERLLSFLRPSDTGATVVGLSGELGAGKTALTKEIGALLGVAETIQSPTFVVMKSYTPHAGPFQKLAHLDAYRIESVDELAPLRFAELLHEPHTLVVIEWPELIDAALPPEMLRVSLAHDGDARRVSYSHPYADA